MIREVWVKNYLSIRDRQEINFLAKGPASELVTEVTEGVFVYKLGILYGSNASGKSNMLIALNGYNAIPLKRGGNESHELVLLKGRNTVTLVGTGHVDFDWSEEVI